MTGTAPERPLVSVIIPIRQEAAYIARSLGAVLRQTYPKDRVEVLLVDGMSSDETRAIAADVAVEHGWAVGALERGPGSVTILDNPARLIPQALNVGVRAARGEYIVRVDGHCEIQPDHVERCVEVLERTGHECVGGGWDTVGESAMSQVIAVATSSVFGVGNASYRTGRDTAGPVDTVPFGAWHRSVFDRFGLFDEELSRAEDDEMAFRITRGGGTIWYEPAIRSVYYSRSDLPRLWRQYFNYGLYKVRVGRKHRAVATVRQLVPGLFVLALGLGAGSSLLTRRARWFAAVAGPYAAANAVMSLRLGAREGKPPAALAATFSTLHLAYGTGYLYGIWRWRHDPPAKPAIGRRAPERAGASQW
jgi:succinoglycan biosynthesis protein ExoA